jgi:Ras-related GTP-binding protein C/D
MLPFMSPGYNHEAIFSSAGSIVWVIDIQDENIHSIHKLVSTALWLMKNYPRINFEVFVHKTDGLSDEYKNNTFRDVRQNIQDELNDRGYGNRSLTFHQTSIYDASIHEAISKVVQRLLPQLPAIETLLTKLCSKCSMQKVYLFDTMSRIYLATDASPTFLRDFEVCSEYVDMIVDAKNIYGWRGNGSQESAYRRRGLRQPQKAPARAGRHDMHTLSDQEDDEGYNDRYYESNDDFDDDSQTKVDSFQHDRVLDSDPDFEDAEVSDNHAGELAGTNTISEAVGESSITLPGSQNLYMIGREINDYLSLICIMGPGSTPNRRVLIDFNIGLAADAIKAIFKMA